MRASKRAGLVTSGGGDLCVVTTAEPHGGQLVSLIVPPARGIELTRRAAGWPSWELTRRQLCDLELLACGGFSPLTGFLGEQDYRMVCRSMRLADGTLWPMPVTLDVPPETAARAGSAGTLALRDTAGRLLAALHVTEAWRPDLRAEAVAVFGTADTAHPGVGHLLHHTHPCYVSGVLEVLQLPAHGDFL